MVLRRRQPALHSDLGGGAAWGTISPSPVAAPGPSSLLRSGDSALPPTGTPRARRPRRGQLRSLIPLAPGKLRQRGGRAGTAPPLTGRQTNRGEKGKRGGGGVVEKPIRIPLLSLGSINTVKFGLKKKWGFSLLLAPPAHTPPASEEQGRAVLASSPSRSEPKVILQPAPTPTPRLHLQP